MTAPGGRVLITGANGFIGRELTRQLVEQAFDINVLQRKEENSSASTLGSGGKVFVGDIGDRALLARALEGVKLVFHLAGIAHVDGSDQDSLQRINVAGTAALIDEAINAKVKKIIYFSSSLAAAAEKREAHSTPYGESKYQAEGLLLKAQEALEIDVCILRPVNVYGVGMKGNLMALIRMIRKGVMPPLPALQTRFSLVGIEDLCRAAILVSGVEQAVGKTYIVTDGIDYHINELESAIYAALKRRKPRWHCPRMVLFTAAVLAGLMAKLVGRKDSIGIRTYRNLVRDNVFSESRLRDELGFMPLTTLYNELPEIVATIDGI